VSPISGTKMATIVRLVFEKLGVKVFLFGPLAAERRTAAGANSKNFSSPLSQKRVVKLEILLQNLKELNNARRRTNL